MFSRSLYLQLFLRVLILVTFAVLFGLALVYNYYLIALVFLALIVLKTIWIVQFLNQTNRKLAHFFNSIKNEDHSFNFDTSHTFPSVRELNKSLNTLNEVVQKFQIKNKAQEEYYQEILKQANIGILTLNHQGHILYANPTVERLLNFSPLNHVKQLARVNKNLYDFFQDLNPFKQQLIQVINEREKAQLALKSTSVVIDNQELFLVVVQDIHKELDEKETHSWTRLFKVLTHEMMNTITPIVSISESILKYYRKEKETLDVENETQQKILKTIKGLEVINEQSISLIDFVKSYRSLLNIPKPDKKIISVKDLLEKIVMLVNQFNKNPNITLKINLPEENIDLFADEQQITQVLLNLCKNALEAMTETKSGEIVLHALRDKNNNVSIKITDNGPGIPKEHLDEIFLPFFTLKTSGTGIGLSVAKHIMQLHGGNLKVVSKPNEETSFTLLF